MSLDKKAHPHRMRKAGKRVLLGETLEEEAARLEKEIAAHPVTRCEPGERGPSSYRPGWSRRPFIPISERTVAEGIAKKMRGNADFFALPFKPLGEISLRERLRELGHGVEASRA